MSRDKCRNCGKMGHWARGCRHPKRTDETHLAQGDEDDEPTLLMARVCTVFDSPPTQKDAPPQSPMPLRLVEAMVFAQLNKGEACDDGLCYLDTGATNHMTGSRDAFLELDSGVHDTVRFGDGSVVNIEGCGMVLFACKTGEHRTITGIYYIPRLTTNLISIGQLDESGCQVFIDGGVLRIRDQRRRLLAKVKRSANRLYILRMKVARLVYLSARC